MTTTLHRPSPIIPTSVRINHRTPFPAEQPQVKFPLRPHSLALESDVQAAADAIRAKWSWGETRRRRWARPTKPKAAAHPSLVLAFLEQQRQQAIRAELVAPTPALPPRSKENQLPPVRPIGEVIAAIIGRLTGQEGGAV